MDQAEVPGLGSYRIKFCTGNPFPPRGPTQDSCRFSEHTGTVGINTKHSFGDPQSEERCSVIHPAPIPAAIGIHLTLETAATHRILCNSEDKPTVEVSCNASSWTPGLPPFCSHDG
jgi:hypothetical protein